MLAHVLITTGLRSQVFHVPVWALLQQQCDDVIEQWTEVPILSHVLLKWEQENEEVSVFLYKM